MAQERIDSIIDQSAIEAEINFLNDNLTQLEGKIGSFGKVVGSLNGAKGFSDIASAQRDLNKVTEESTNLQQKRAAVVQEVVKMQSQLNGSTKETLQNSKLLLQVEREQIKNAQENTKTVKGQTDAYGQLTRAYNVQQREAKNLTLIYGKESEEAKKAVAVALALDTEIKAIDKSVGQSQRNVGNYSSAFTNGLGKVFGVLRNIAYILPGVGLAGLLGFLVDPIINLTKKLLTAGGAIDAFKEKTKLLDESLDDSQLKDASKKVEEVGAAFELAKTGVISNDEALKVYNTTLGDTFGKANSLTDAEKKYQENSENFIKATLFRAAAMKALEKASESALKAVEAQFKPAKTFSTALDQGVIAGGEFGPDVNVINDQQERIKLLQEKRRKEEIQGEQDKQKTFEKIAQELFADAEKSASKLPKFHLFGDDNGAAMQRDFDQARKAFFELFKLRKEAEAAAEKEQSENLANSLKTRIAARQSEFEAQKAIIIATKDFEIGAINQKATDELKQDKLTAKQKADINKTAAADIAVALQKSVNDRSKLEDDLSKDIIKIRQDEKSKDKALLDADVKLFTDANAKRLADELKTAETILKRRTANNQEDRDNELKKLEEDRKAGKLREDKNPGLAKNRKAGLAEETEYQAKRLDIETRFTNAGLQIELDYTEKLVELAKAKGEDVAALEAKLANIRLEIARNEADKKKKIDDKSLEDKKRNLEKLNKQVGEVRDVSLKAVDAIGSILNAGSTAQKNKIQEQIDLLDERTQKEIEAVNQQSISEQQKADKIAVINARAAAQKETLQRRQRQLDEQQARFDKAKAIASILLNTAQAVTAALTSIPPNVPLAVAVGVIGAAELAAAIATPIPKFADGGKVSRDTWALTDEKGAEGYTTPDGKSFIGQNNGPMLRYLKAGTEVTPAHIIARRMVGERLPQFSSPNVSAGAGKWDEMISEQQLTRKEIRKQSKNVQINNQINIAWWQDKQQHIFK